MTFYIRHSQAKCIVATASVCVRGWVCVCVHATFPRYGTHPDVTLGNGRACPLGVHYTADLQSDHGFCCYECTHVLMRNVSECPCTRTMDGFKNVFTPRSQEI